MMKISKVVLSLMFAMSLFMTRSSSASPITPGSTWSWGGLYATSYTAGDTGEIGVVFENSAGVQFTAWNNAAGVNQCPGQPMLRLAPGFPAAPGIAKILLAAALSHKPMHVWFEATAGICYIKAISATM